MRIRECAPQDARNALEPFIDQVLDVLGHPEALVTDESRVRDFLDWTDRPGRIRRRGGPWVERPADPEAGAANEATMTALREKLKVPVEQGDYIVDVARRMKALGHA
jgi:hypothetical protein